MSSTPEKKTNWFYIVFLVLSIFLAVGLFSTLIYVYRDNFGIYPSIKKDEWGAFGDFIGGLLNPVIAGLALFWLIYSVTLQNKELQKSSAALTETVNTAKKQNEQVSIQNFESLFFQLLKTKTDVTNDILVGSKDTLYQFATFRSSDANSKIKEMSSSNHKVIGKESIKDHLILFKSHVPHSWEKFYTASFLDYAGSYFRISYQIVKLIDQNVVLNALPTLNGRDYSQKQKEYFDIFRATFTQYELEAFFFNCLSKYGKHPFKSLLEKYGMFEPLLIDNDRLNERVHALTRYAYKYDKVIFEKNELWQVYFKGVENLKKANMNFIVEGIIYLYDIGILEVETAEYYMVENQLLNKNNMEKVEILTFYIKSKSINELGINLSKRIELEEKNLIDFRKSLDNSNEKDKEYWSEKILKTQGEVEELKSLKNIDEIQFILSSRILPMEFLQYRI